MRIHSLNAHRSACEEWILIEFRPDVGGSVRPATNQSPMNTRCDPAKIRQEVIYERHWRKVLDGLRLRASLPRSDSCGDHALDRKSRIPQIPQTRRFNCGARAETQTSS